MTANEIENLNPPVYDSDNAIYWRRKCGELMVKVAELESEIGKLNAIQARVQNVHTCE